MTGKRKKPPRKRTRFSFGDPKHGAGGRGDFGLTWPEKPRPKPKPLPKPEPKPVPGAAYAPGEPFTPEAGAAVTALIAANHWQETAAKSIGRTPGTVRSWVRRGEADLEAGLDTPLARFAQDFHTAEGQALAQMDSLLNEHARADGRVALQLAAKKRPDLFGQKVAPQLVRIIVDRLLDTVRERATPEEFERFCELLDPDTIEVDEIET